MSEELQQGDYCHYTRSDGGKENGRIKSIGEEYAFVVFRCNKEWDKYEDYTGQRTQLSDLKLGWVDENGNPINTPVDKRKECDHHYVPTNAKWQPINQRQCVHCGNIID
jgi:hypothetical protein